MLLTVLPKMIIRRQSKLNNSILLRSELQWLTPIVSVLQSLSNLKLGFSQQLFLKSNHALG